MAKFVFQTLSFILLLGFCCPCTLLQAKEKQASKAQSDSFDYFSMEGDTLFTSNIAIDTVSSYEKHNPSKATLMSVVLPGLGQAYNKKYWKIPIVYAAIGVSAYLYINYNNQFKKYRQAYVDYYDTDASTDSYLDFDIPKGVTTARYITVYKDNYRKWRDWASIAVAITYVLNIMDATVDAHFFDFNIDDNLTMQVHPQIINDIDFSKKLGINLSFSF